MTETTPVKQDQSMTLARSQRQSVAAYGDDRSLRLEMQMYRTALPGMRGQPDEAVMAVIIAGKMLKLDPMSGDIYYIPGKGVTVASKIRASRAVEAAQRRGDNLTIRFETFSKMHPLYEALGEPDLQNGDTCFLCEVSSYRAKMAYIREKSESIGQWKLIGYTRQEIEEKLKEYPPEPVYRSVGIVRANEKVGTNTFTKNDFARKRALQKCLNAHGLAAPDQRDASGAPIKMDDDGVITDARYTVKQPAAPMQSPEDLQRQIDPEFAAAAMTEDAQFQPAEPETQSEPEQTKPNETQHQDDQRKLGRSNEADPSAPFGGDDKPRSAASVAVSLANSLKSKTELTGENIAQLRTTWASLYQVASNAGLSPIPVLDSKTKPSEFIAAILDVGNRVNQAKLM